MNFGKEGKPMKHKAVLILITVLASLAVSASAQAACPSTAGATQLTTGLTTTTYTDSSIADGASYDYMVEAVNSFGGFSCSNVVLNAVIPATGTHTVALTWNASTTSGVTYAVFRAQTPANPTSLTVTVN
jgi:hypothetical protein